MKHSESAGAAPEPASPERPIRVALGGAIAAALVVALILSPTLLYPFGRDQAVFAYVGRVIASGGAPYRDAWDLKPPAIYAVYALLASLAGPDAERLMFLVRVADVALAAVSGALIAVLAHRWIAPGAAVPAAAWFGLLYLQTTFWSMAQAEAWAVPLLLGCVGCCLAAQQKPDCPWLQLAAGLLAGTAAALKFTAVLPALPFLAVLVWARPRRLPLVLAGLLAPLVASMLLLQAWGAWEAYLDVQRGFVAPYSRMHAENPFSTASRLVGYTLGWLKQLWLPAGLSVFAAVWARRDRSEFPGRTSLGLLLAGGLFSVWVQGKYFGYHWILVLPAVALLSAAGSVFLSRTLGLRLPQIVSVGALLAWAILASGAEYRDALRRAAGSLPREAWLARFGPPGKGDFSFVADGWAARYAREHTQLGDSILVWGFEPAVYLLSGRSAPTRFFFNVPVTARFAPERWRAELLSDLHRRPPKLVLVVREDRIPWASGRADDSAAQLESWPALREWLERNYRRQTEIEHFTVWRRAG